MPVEEDLQINGGGRTQTIYQQSSTGEKHVIFYPTSPAPSVNSDDKRCWSKATSSIHNTQIRNTHKTSIISDNNTIIRMKKSEGAGTSHTLDSGGQSVEPNTLDGFQTKYNFKIGIYGWRKRCLYILILILLVMVIVNLSLTLWVLKVMEFSSEGMGQLKIVSGGLKLEGKAFVLDTLIASSIKSRTGQPIVVESSRNMTLLARNKNGLVNNFIFLGNDRFECLANKFKIMDDRGGLLFSADGHEIVVGAENLKVTGEGGTSFSGSVQTTLVRAHSGHNLRLESPTRSLDIHGPQGIHIESLGGKIKIISLNDISFKSEMGSIRLDTSSIIMPSLPTAIPTSKPSSNNYNNNFNSHNNNNNNNNNKNHEIFQLCVCNNGRLFLVPPHSHCVSENDDPICR